LSTISRYFKKGYNNESDFTQTQQKEEDRLINEETKKMLDEVIKFKTNAYNKFKANKIEDAMKDYFTVN